MCDLISRSALIKRLEEWNTEDVYDKAFYRFAMNRIIEQPTVEPVSGEWKYYKKQGIATCSNCSFERNLDDNFGSAIACPNCGADMRKAGENKCKQD